MDIVTLLLVSAVFQLGSPTPASTAQNPQNNLKHIIDLVSQFNTSFTTEYFVEDVTELCNLGCKNEFFCKVHNILHNRTKLHEDNLENKLLRIGKNLQAFINGSNINCAEMKMKVSIVKKPITTLLENISKCSKYKNFNGLKQNTAS